MRKTPVMIRPSTFLLLAPLLLIGRDFSTASGQEKSEKKSDKPAASSPQETEKRLTEKVERVTAGAKKWAASGRDPSEVIKIMQEKFAPLMNAGKVSEAEAVVDSVLKRLGLDINALAVAPANGSSDEDRMLTKIHLIQKELPAWIKKTGKKAEADILMRFLKEQLAAKKFAEGAKTAEEILEMIGVKVVPDAQPERHTTTDDSKKANDPMAGFFPQQLVFLASDRIALKPEQRDVLLARVKKTQPRLDELKIALEHESAAFAALISQERVDEEAALTQLNKLLDVESQTKKLQLGLGVTIQNLLTKEQQATLRDLMRNPDGVAKLEEEFRKRITAKVELVTTGVQKWAASGRDASSIAQLMQENVRPLMESGRPFEAEAEIDRVLEQLNKETK